MKLPPAKLLALAPVSDNSWSLDRLVVSAVGPLFQHREVIPTTHLFGIDFWCVDDKTVNREGGASKRAYFKAYWRA